MSENEGRQSPPPEQQTGAQQQDPPANAKGVNPDSNNQDESKSQIDVCLDPSSELSAIEGSYLNLNSIFRVES